MENQESILPLRVKKVIQLPRWIFVISLIIGIILFILITMNKTLDKSKNEDMMIIGFMYILIAIYINAIAAGILAVCAYVFPKHKYEIIGKLAILFLNIPVAILCCYLILSRI